MSGIKRLKMTYGNYVNEKTLDQHVAESDKINIDPRMTKVAAFPIFKIGDVDVCFAYDDSNWRITEVTTE